jgi:hypothetical protein
MEYCMTVGVCIENVFFLRAVANKHFYGTVLRFAPVSVEAVGMPQSKNMGIVAQMRKAHLSPECSHSWHFVGIHCFIT